MLHCRTASARQGSGAAGPLLLRGELASPWLKKWCLVPKSAEGELASFGSVASCPGDVIIYLYKVGVSDFLVSQMLV